MNRHRIDPGWVVVFAGLGVNLVLGVLYAWGVISAALIDRQGWSATMTQIPYMVACAVFALSMVPGGRLQDRIGPRPVVMGAAVLAGIGFLMSGWVLTLPGLTAFFGIVFGAGMGLGYAAPTPAAVKWFSPRKRGLISGIVVSGFGLAPVYIAPLTTYLLNHFTLSQTFMILGAGFFSLIMSLSLLIRNPTPERLAELAAIPSVPPSGTAGGATPKDDRSAPPQARREYDWDEAFRTPQFKLLWTMFCFGTFAGLLIIGQMSKIGLEQAGIRNGFMLISVYAVFNCTGRILCGMFSDLLGRMRTLRALFLMQVLTFALFAFLTTPLSKAAGVAVVGFTFGGMLSLFPATTADFFGMRNFGVNYGMMLTAWGVGGVFGPLLGGIVRDATGAYVLSYVVSAVLSAAGALLTLITKAPREPVRGD